MPVDDRRPGNAHRVNIGTTQHGERSHVAAERPAEDADPLGVDLGEALAGEAQRLDLILKRDVAEVAADRPLPGAAAEGRTTTIGQKDDEAVIRQPLVEEIAAGHRHDVGVVRPAVDVDEDGVRRPRTKLRGRTMAARKACVPSCTSSTRGINGGSTATLGSSPAVMSWACPLSARRDAMDEHARPAVYGKGLADVDAVTFASAPGSGWQAAAKLAR